MNSIGERIARRRKELGLTQRELAEKLHVSDKTVSRWETDRQIPDALTIQDIAATLAMPLSELYGMEQSCEQAEKKSLPFEKIRKIFCLGLAVAVLIVLLGFFTANRELTSQVSCQIDEFPMYMLTGNDSSIVEWVELCREKGEELSHISAQAGETAYYLFYLPRGWEDTELRYSYRNGLRGRVLRLEFENLSEQGNDNYFLCYLKFPCEDSFILKTYIDGKRVDSYAGYAMFVGLCESIFG